MKKLAVFFLLLLSIAQIETAKAGYILQPGLSAQNLVAGTVALPGLSYADNPGTGINHQFNTRIGISNDGVGTVSFDTSGVVFNMIGGRFVGFVDAGHANAANDSDLRLYRDAAGILAQRNGTLAQKLRVGATWTDASNYESAALSAVAGSGVVLAAETAGTGGDNLNITLTPAGTGGVLVPSQQSTTGQRYLCITTTGKIVSSAAACVGT